MTDEKDEGKYVEEKQVGQEAWSELSLTNELYDKAEMMVVNAWVSTGQNDSERRETLWHVLQGVRLGRVNLQSLVNTGKLAEASLLELEAQREKRKQFGAVSAK